MTYIHAPVRVILQDRNEVRVEIDNSERVVPIPSGAQGLPGEPGFSPIVTVEPITGGNRVTITDEEGDNTFDVMNGQQGEQGEPGEGVPTGGVTGQVLKKRSNTNYDTYWANESGTVLSVNGKTGAVELDASDVGALPDDTFIPTKTSDLTNDSGFTDVHVGASAPTDPDTQIWLDTDEPGQSAVTSVNGASGAVTLDASDVGALAETVLSNTTPETGFPANLQAGQYIANCINIGSLKIQYGIIATNNATQHTITFKEPFANIGYSAFASYTADTSANINNSAASITNQHTDYCNIYSQGGRYAWLCIGY